MSRRCSPERAHHHRRRGVARCTQRHHARGDRRCRLGYRRRGGRQGRHPGKYAIRGGSAGLHRAVALANLEVWQDGKTTSNNHGFDRPGQLSGRRHVVRATGMTADWLFDRLATFGDEPALVHRDQPTTYRALLEKTKEWTPLLTDLGIGAGSVVVVDGSFSLAAVSLVLTLI